MSFTGTQTIQLDEKNRLRIPSRFRSELGSRYFILQGISGCLFVMSEAEFKKFKAPLDNIPISDVKGQARKRRLMVTVTEPEEDSQGRFVISSFHKGAAAIDKKVIFVGMGEYLELWGEERFNAVNAPEADGSENIDEVYTGLSGYGV